MSTTESGVKYIYSNEIIRDLKTENGFLDAFLHPKIAVLGFLKKYHFNLQTLVLSSSNEIKGSSLHMSPEIFETMKCTKESDAFEFDFIIYPNFEILQKSEKR